MLVKDSDVLKSLEFNSRTARPKTKRVTGIANELFNASFRKNETGELIKVAFLPYAKGDRNSDGDVTPEAKREFDAVGAIMSDLGVSKRNANPEQNWKTITVLNSKGVVGGKTVHVFRSYFKKELAETLAKAAKAKEKKAPKEKKPKEAPIEAPIVS